MSAILVIDNIIFYLQKSGGVSVVWYELISRLLVERKFSVYFIEYKRIAQNIFYNKLKILDRERIPLRLLCLRIQRFLPIKLCCMQKYPFIFHSSYYRYSTNPNAINITTVHDFTYEYYNKGLAKWLHCWQKYRAIRHSDHIICISENTRKDLLKFLPDITENKVSVIYNGVSDDYYPIQNDISADLPFVRHEYVLFVGARSGYKNFEFVVDALEALLIKKLVIVGSPLTVKEQKMLRLRLGEERYHCVGRISNERLNLLYNNAFALIYPSYYEGFGIPVLEAQKAGCPVIAYNSSSITEIIGNTTLLLNELSVDSLKKKFELLENEEIRNEIVKAGITNASKYTWNKMYDQVKELYQEVLHKRVLK